MVTAAFLRTFHHEGKISLAGQGGGVARPPPFTTITRTITSKVAVYAPAESADTLTLFHPQYMYSVVVIIAKICMHIFYSVQLLPSTVHCALCAEYSTNRHYHHWE